MTNYAFDMQLVVDPFNTSNVVANGQVYVYDPADVDNLTPLTLTDPNGLPLTNPMVSNSNGFLPAFIATLPQVKWVSGGFVGYFSSYEGLRDEAVAARQAAEAAIEAAGVSGQALGAYVGRIGSSELKLTTANYYRGVLPSGADLNALTANSDNGIWVLSGNSTYVNAPFAGAGHVNVTNTSVASGEQRAVRYGFNETYWRNVRNYYSTPRTWGAWEKSGITPTDVLTGASLDDYRTPGEYMIQNTTVATSITAGWPAQIARGPLWLRVRATATGIVFQEAQNYGTGATLLYRATESIGTAPFPFGPWQTPVASVPAAPASALANTLRGDDFTQRRGGVKKTGGIAAVAFRFDHGLNNFDSVIRPLMEARGLPYSLALNSGGWSTAENNAVTASMVNGWVTGGLAEVWNHAKYHWDVATESGILDYIADGLAQLRSQIPAASIDGFTVPGVGATGYDGFLSGSTPEQFYQTYAGRLILEHHAVSSGAFPNSAHRVLDGRLRQGMGHLTIEAQTSAQVITEIGTAQTNKRGLQLMMHPSLINTAGYMTTASLAAVLDHVVTERNAGRLKVYGPYDLLLADAT